MVGVRRYAGLALILATVTAGCAPVGGTGTRCLLTAKSSTSATSAGPTASSQPPTPAERGPRVAPEPAVDVEAVAAGLRGSAEAVAAIVFDRQTGSILIEEQPDRHFQSASLVKLLIAVDRLSAPTDEPTRARLHAMLSASDDMQASGFWVAGGGGAIVTRTAAALGLSAAPPAVEGSWGYARISARDVLTVYRHILDGMAAGDRELILSALRSTPRTAADGVDQHFGIPAGLPGRPWATKQGWSSGQGVVAAHSAGLVGEADRYVVVLMVERPAGVGMAAARDAATRAAGALAPLLG